MSRANTPSRAVVVSVLCLLTVMFLPLKALAASGVTLTPPLQEITILPNQNSVDSSFVLTNNNAVPEHFDLTAIDMGALDDSGGVVFSGLPADYQQKYGLTKWLQLSADSVTLPGKSSQTINFSVANAPDMTPGGHYGAIVVKAEGKPASVNNQIDLQPQAASLLFVRKVGGEKYGLNLEKGPKKTYAWRLPSTLDITLRNSGNIHVVPRGFVILKDPSGQQIAKGIINPESSIILPEHDRIYSVNLAYSEQARRPGTYTAEVSYRYDGTQTFTHGTIQLRFINLMLFGLILLFAVAIGSLIWSRAIRNWAVVRRLRTKSKPKAGKPAARSTFMSVRRLDNTSKNHKASKK